MQAIYGAGKTALINDTVRSVVSRLSQYGFVIDQLTFNSALRLPDNVMGAINRAMEATQNAIQAENRVRQIRAEADQAIARAHGAAQDARPGDQGGRQAGDHGARDEDADQPGMGENGAADGGHLSRTRHEQAHGDKQ